jgi:hypothetical protein
MVWLNAKLKYFEAVSFTNFTQKFFNITPYAKEFHWIFGILGLPHKVEAILTN